VHVPIFPYFSPYFSIKFQLPNYQMTETILLIGIWILIGNWNLNIGILSHFGHCFGVRISSLQRSDSCQNYELGQVEVGVSFLNSQPSESEPVPSPLQSK